MLTLKTPINDNFNYIGLNQYFKYWESKGYIKIEVLPADRRFVSYIGDLIIAPEDIVQINDYKYIWALQWRNNPNWTCKPNVFKGNWWVRDWNSYYKVQKDLDPNNKIYESIYSGTIRGKKHVRNNWINSTEVWSSSPAKRYTKTNRLYKTMEDYYKALSYTYFGLCLPGDCPVCQREIEGLGIGCVPIYTPGVEYDYYNKPELNKHFIYCDAPKKLDEVMDDISDEQYKYMQEEGIKYFNLNNSPEGMFKNLLQIIEANNIKV